MSVLPMSVQVSPVEAWVSSGPGMVGGTECACTRPFEGGPIIFITSITVWPQVKQQGGNTAPPRDKNWTKFAEQGPSHQGKTQFPSQSVSPVNTP